MKIEVKLTSEMGDGINHKSSFKVGRLNGDHMHELAELTMKHDKVTQDTFVVFDALNRMFWNARNHFQSVEK